MREDDNPIGFAMTPVHLRPVRADDAPAVVSMLQGPDAEYFSLGEEGETEALISERLHRLAVASPAWGGGWAVVRTGSEDAVGLIVFGDRQPKDQRATIAYVLAPAARGRGIMTHALTLALGQLFETGLHRVEADVEPENIRSRVLLHKLGFRQEGGLLRDRVVTRGMRRSVLMYAVLAPEWWAHRARAREFEQDAACAE